MSQDLRKYPLRYVPGTSSLSVFPFESMLLQKALAEDLTVREYIRSGDRTATYDDFMAGLLRVMGPEAATFYAKTEERTLQTILASPNSMAHVSGSKKSPYIYVDFYSCDEAVAAAAKTYLVGAVKRPKSQGQVWVVVDNGDGPALTRLGVAGETFEPGNKFSLGEIYRNAGPHGAAARAEEQARVRVVGFAPEPRDEKWIPGTTVWSSTAGTNDPEAFGRALSEFEDIPADVLGLRPGETAITDEGDLVRVRPDGQLELVEEFEDEDTDPGSAPDDDDDLIDEDPTDDGE